MTKTVCIILTDGFEEVEAIYPADIFKRLGLNIILAGLNKTNICGTHGINIQTSLTIKDIDVSDFDALMLPGGLPGTTNMLESAQLLDLVKKSYQNNKIIAAICAAPTILHKAGITQNKTTTGYPSCENLITNNDFKFSGNMVEVSQNIITAIGMGQAAPFAFAIAKSLGISDSQINQIKQSAFILYD